MNVIRKIYFNRRLFVISAVLLIVVILGYATIVANDVIQSRRTLGYQEIRLDYDSNMTLNQTAVDDTNTPEVSETIAPVVEADVIKDSVDGVNHAEIEAERIRIEYLKNQLVKKEKIWYDEVGELYTSKYEELSIVLDPCIANPSLCGKQAMAEMKSRLDGLESDLAKVIKYHKEFLIAIEGDGSIPLPTRPELTVDTYISSSAEFDYPNVLPTIKAIPYKDSDSVQTNYDNTQLTDLRTPSPTPAINIYGIPGVSYTQIGGTVYGSDGSTYQKIGNTIYSSDGRSYQQIGNSLYGSDGSSSQHIGSTTYWNDGSTYQKIGNTIYGNDNTSCSRIGNTTYCN